MVREMLFTKEDVQNNFHASLVACLSQRGAQERSVSG